MLCSANKVITIMRQQEEDSRIVCGLILTVHMWTKMSERRNRKQKYIGNMLTGDGEALSLIESS